MANRQERLKFPSESKTEDNLFMMRPISFVVAMDQLTKKQKIRTDGNPGAAIVLPTPSSGLILNESGNWDETEGFQHAVSKQGAIDFATKSLASNVVQAAGSAGRLAMKGQFINDYASLAYQGSNFRAFTFSWDLIPRSKTEAINIAKIIKRIRENSLPKYTGLNVNYPSFWQVFPSINNHDKTFSIQNCVITDFTVNFTPDGILKTYESGHPLSVNMEISFKELLRADRRDV